MEALNAWAKETELSARAVRVAREAAEIARLRGALTEIRDGRRPQVCAEYEICVHDGCRASYAAFAIADSALFPLEGK